MKTFKYISIFLLTLMVLGSFSGIYATKQSHNNGKTIYVAKNGTDRNDGLNPNTPKRNIANALLSANPGDTIQVGPGTYTEFLQINKNITLIGNKQENTIIDGRNINTCINIQPGVVVTITNFTIKKGSGVGITNQGNLTVKNSTITNNSGKGIYNVGVLALSYVTITNNSSGDWGGGITNYLGGTMTVEDSTITNNTATWGAGIENVGDATLRRVILKNNHAHMGGGIDTCRPLTLEDCCISDNIATEIGGGIKNDAEMWVYGCTIINNRAPNGGGIFSNYLATSYVDDWTVNDMKGNVPNNFGGKPYIPA